MNTELVVTILKGITILAAGSSDNTDNMTESDMLKIRQTATIEIDKIRIQNAKLWEIGAKTSGNNDAGENGAGFDSDDEDAIQVANGEDDTVASRSRSWNWNPFANTDNIRTTNPELSESSILVEDTSTVLDGASI